MIENKIKSTLDFGYEETTEQKKIISSKDLYKESLFSTTTIKYIKIWFGSPPHKKGIQSLLGLEVKYINLLTGKIKETRYQGAKIEGDDVITNELELKEGEYFTKINFIFSD